MNNQPVKILLPKTKIGFSVELFVRFVVLIPIFFVAGFMILSAILSIQKGIKGEYYSLVMGMMFLIATGMYFFKIFYAKPRYLRSLQYLIYADRLVFYNSKSNKMVRTIPYDTITEFSFYENLNNFGYIVIGSTVPLIDKIHSRSLKWGVSMEDPEIMLENLPEVKQEYLFLKELIEKNREAAVEC